MCCVVLCHVVPCHVFYVMQCYVVPCVVLYVICTCMRVCIACMCAYVGMYACVYMFNMFECKSCNLECIYQCVVCVFLSPPSPLQRERPSAELTPRIFLCNQKHVRGVVPAVREFLIVKF